MKRIGSARKGRKPVPSPSTPVSSRGCSKAFIICFLTRILEYCRSIDKAPDFPFESDLVAKWLVMARRDCIMHAIEDDFGGVVFEAEDTSSYWTATFQYFTWWKNNIERRKKFRMLKLDASYRGEDENLIKRYHACYGLRGESSLRSLNRARFCANAVVLSVNIRNHFDKFRLKTANRSQSVAGPQYKIPFQESLLKAVHSGLAALAGDDNKAQIKIVHDDDHNTLGMPQIVYYDHLSEDDLNGVEAMMHNDYTDRHSDTPRPIEWENVANCFDDGMSECEESTLLDEPPHRFEGEMIGLHESILTLLIPFTAADRVEADTLEELTCVSFLRASTPIDRLQTTSTNSLLSLGTSCSSDCDDSSLSTIAPSPLPSPYILDRRESELPIEISFEDYWSADEQIFGEVIPKPIDLKMPSWTFVDVSNKSSSIKLSKLDRGGGLSAFFSATAKNSLANIKKGSDQRSELSDVETSFLQEDTFDTYENDEDRLGRRRQRARKMPKKYLDGASDEGSEEIGDYGGDIYEI